jgi:hypothetical protein
VVLTLVVLALAGAPVALEVCRVACASAATHGEDRSSQAVSPLCHEDGGSVGSSSRVAASHGCGHADELPLAAQSSTASVIDVADLPLTAFAGAPALDAVAWAPADFDPVPPERIARRHQLRI